MKPRKILRPKATYAKLGCGKTKFDDDYRYHSADNPFVPGTNILRLKPIPLGERNIGYLEHEADELIDALAKLRDAAPALPRTTTAFLTDAMPPNLQQKYKDHLIERRARLRAQLTGDPDPELKSKIEQIDRELRAFEQPRCLGPSHKPPKDAEKCDMTNAREQKPRLLRAQRRGEEHEKSQVGDQ